MATLRLVPLGTNGFYPSFGRHTMSFLLLARDRAVLLDAGSGVSRLGEPAVERLVRPYQRLDVLLSHYHLDHVIGLSYLPALWPRGAIRILAPGAGLGTAEPGKALHRLIAPPLFPLRLDEFPVPVEVVPLDSGGTRVAGLRVRLQAQRHPGGSVGIRIGDLLAYITDTTTGPSTVDFVRGVRLLLHELWMDDEEGDDSAAERSGHTRLGRLAECARAAGVGSLMPVHHHPGRSNAGTRSLGRRLERRSGVRTILPREGQVYLVKSRG